jgi:hypothetical protein
MKIEEIKAAKDERPFQRFTILTADGREFPVNHPDAVAWGESSRIIVCGLPSGGWHVIDVALITSLGFGPIAVS